MACNCNENPCGSGTEEVNDSSCTEPTVVEACTSDCASESCAEDHCQKVYFNNVNTVIRIADSWIIPACGLTVDVTVDNLQAILVGANIWNPTYGFFEVTAFDLSRNRITLKNNCLTMNAAPGTSVPACSGFVVGPAPCCGNDPDIEEIIPYLASDFVAPPADPSPAKCVTIEVTTVFGLESGKNVVLGGGTYLIDSILDSTHIIICNMGLGAIPLTVIHAHNAGGDLQYQLTIVDRNPCSVLSDTPVVLVGCKAGVLTPLVGTVGWVPVCINSATDEAEYQDIGITRIPTDSQLLNIPTEWASWNPVCTNFTILQQFMCYWRQVGEHTIEVKADLAGSIIVPANTVRIGIPPGFTVTAHGDQLINSRINAGAGGGTTIDKQCGLAIGGATYMDFVSDSVFGGNAATIWFNATIIVQ